MKDIFVIAIILAVIFGGNWFVNDYIENTRKRIA